MPTKAIFLLSFAIVCGAADATYDYRVLATSKTSTLEREMNEAAEAGFRFEAVMGGETASAGSEGVLIMSKALGD